MFSDFPYWLAVNSFLGIGPLRFKVLLDYFGTAKKVWEAPEKELLKINLGEKLTKNFLVYRQTFDISSYLFRLKKLGGFALTCEDENYPERLEQIDSPPPVIYVYSIQYTVYSMSIWGKFHDIASIILRFSNVVS